MQAHACYIEDSKPGKAFGVHQVKEGKMTEAHSASCPDAVLIRLCRQEREWQRKGTRGKQRVEGEQ